MSEIWSDYVGGMKNGKTKTICRQDKKI